MVGRHKAVGEEEKQTKPRGMCNFPGSALLGLDEKIEKSAVADIYIYIYTHIKKSNKKKKGKQDAREV